MEGIHECFGRWNPLLEGNWVIATLISSQGHSYRKPGAVMLFDRDGPAAGSLSPGCLEADLAEHARSVLEAGEARTVTYDTYDLEDTAWGETAFCGGSITVLLEPLEGELKTAFLQLRSWLSQGRRVNVVRIFDRNGKVLAYRLNRDDGCSKRYGQVNRPFRTMTARYAPRPRLILFGAGKDAGPVAELAARSGFHVIAADWREGETGAGSVSVTASCVRSPLNTLLDKVRVLPGDRVIVMSHQFRQDRFLLERLLPLPVRYIGILGSKARTARLLEGLLPEPDSRVHAPVGLPIGASGPEQIAVSIVGELIRDWKEERLAQEGDALPADGEYGGEGWDREAQAAR